MTIRPIAGTRWRSDVKAEDERLAADLLADEKERAEHLMLLDLGRNDVGRVAKTGTVRVTDSFTIERYSHVMHIVSNVEGELDARARLHRRARRGLSRRHGLWRAQGARHGDHRRTRDRQARHLRRLHRLFRLGGQMDTCIVLRTAIVKDGKMHVQAGAGVVYDSEPEYEHRECVNKAKALFRAAEEAVRFATRARRGQ